jgi:hypothetical protein
MAVEESYCYSKGQSDSNNLQRRIFFGYDSLGLTFLGRSSHQIAKRSTGNEDDVQPHKSVEQHIPVVRQPHEISDPDDDEYSYRYAEAFGILALGVVVILLLGITMVFIIDFSIDLDNTDLENNVVNPWGSFSHQSTKIIQIIVLMKKKFPVMLNNKLWSKAKTITVIV